MCVCLLVRKTHFVSVCVRVCLYTPTNACVRVITRNMQVEQYTGNTTWILIECPTTEHTCVPALVLISNARKRSSTKLECERFGGLSSAPSPRHQSHTAGQGASLSTALMRRYKTHAKGEEEMTIYSDTENIPKGHIHCDKGTAPGNELNHTTGSFDNKPSKETRNR